MVTRNDAWMRYALVLVLVLVLALALGLSMTACTRGEDGGGPGGPGGPGEGGDGGGEGGAPPSGGGGEFAAPTLQAPEGTQCTLVPGMEKPPGWGVGEPVMVAGTFSQPDGLDIDVGMMLLEVVPAGSTGETIYHFICGDRTTFEVALPADMGQVALVAFLDVSGDGPVGDDPRGRHLGMLNIQGAGVDGVEIALSVGAELGDMAVAFPDEPPDAGVAPEMPPQPSGDRSPPDDHVDEPEGTPGGGPAGEPPPGDPPPPADAPSAAAPAADVTPTP